MHSGAARELSEPLRIVDEVTQDDRVVAGIVTLDEDPARLMEDRRAKTADGSSDHGVLHACASTATSPKDSEYEGTTVMSAARYQSASI